MAHKYNKGSEWRKYETLKGIVDRYLSLEVLKRRGFKIE